MEERFGTWHDPTAFILGIWLLMAPLFLGFPALDHPATVVMWLAAVLMFMSAYDILVMPGVGEEWLDAAVGAGVLLSPWLLGYSDMFHAVVNAVACGIVILVCAVLAHFRDHGWHGQHTGR